MPMQWHQLEIVGKCDRDDGYDQTLTLWVQAYGRERAVAKAMLDVPLISDAELRTVAVLVTQDTKPADWNIIRDPDRGDYDPSVVER